MIRIIVEAPKGAGKSFFIKHCLQPAIAQCCSKYFALSIGGFEIIERHCESDGKPINELLKDFPSANTKRPG